MKDLRIRRLRIVAYRGVEALDVKIAPGGAIIRGKNGAGKSSVLNAIKAALIARDIGEDAIRMGEERAEILVDLGEVQATRTITEDGSKLTLQGEHGKIAKAQAVLNELLGTTSLDPLELLLEHDPKKRRARVLAALPVKLTREDIIRVTKGAAASILTPADIGPALEAHGLEACAQLRRVFYEARTEVNAEAKRLGARVKMLEGALEAIGPTLPDAMTVRDAEDALSKARAMHAELTTVRAARQAAIDASSQTRASIASLRTKAEGKRREASAIRPADQAVQKHGEERANAKSNVADLRARLEKAMEIERGATAWCDDDTEKVRMAEALETEAVESVSRADELAQALASLPKPPTEEEIAEAAKARDLAQKHVADADKREEQTKAKAALAEARALEKATGEKAGHLTAAVDAFTHEIPAKLIAESKGIEGLGVAGDEITLNGVALDSLSGREQMKLAVEIARRANVKARILIVDGLERLDSDQLPAFVREATRDGFQLLATKVDKGDVVIESVEMNEGGEL